jgi:hypothetical protein
LDEVVEGFDDWTRVLLNGTDARGCFEIDPNPKVAGVCLIIGSTFGSGAGCLVNPENPEKGFEGFEGAAIDPKELNGFLTGVSDDSRLSLG